MKVFHVREASIVRDNRNRLNGVTQELKGHFSRILKAVSTLTTIKMTTCLIFSLRFGQIRLKLEPTMIST